MPTIAINTLDVNEAIAAMLRPFPVKLVARKIKASARTVENWREGRTGPQVKHVAAMLHDADLGPALLSALGRADLATQAEILSLNQRIDALKNAEKRHGEQANAILQDLEVGSSSGSVAGRPAQPGRDTLEEDRGVVSRSTD